ncbi:amblin-like [Plodia interpunctella]|uniref:amblin-like n=1 Tax=Plodia interpunctella TaxID=58824 RepID=UPI00236871B2|nr:amblin-like isoform X1 [Plodia interpunctella]
MYKEIIFAIFLIYYNDVICGLLEMEKEETTRAPMDLTKLNNELYCKFQPNEYDCGEKDRRHYNWYYFDLKLEDCKPISSSVGDCSDNKNAFSSLKNCKETCREFGMVSILPNLTENVFCRLQFDFGDCSDYHPLWYFDVSTRTCKGFSYSGCGGNQNKFGTQQDCTTACLPNVDYNVRVL